MDYEKYGKVVRIGNATLINCDCMDLMADAPANQWNLAVTDPPYGNKNHDAMHKVSAPNTRAAERPIYKKFDNTKPTDNYFEELKRISINQIVWGGNFFGLSGGYICWQKNGSCFGEAELAFCSMQKQVNVFEYTWNGMIQGDMKNKEARIHPTQKPVKLYEWLLTNYAKPGDRILDTHLGSMSSVIACADLGFEITGCELDKDYFDAGCKRVIDAQRQGKLLEPDESPRLVQAGLL